VAKAFADAEFVSPRGPIRFDKETHHIIQQMYVIETVLENGKTENKVIDEIGEVRDPGK
jgi:branched-chain amino acid transport system substrate-binding protein